MHSVIRHCGLAPLTLLVAAFVLSGCSAENPTGGLGSVDITGQQQPGDGADPGNGAGGTSTGTGAGAGTGTGTGGQGAGAYDPGSPPGSPGSAGTQAAGNAAIQAGSAPPPPSGEWTVPTGGSGSALDCATFSAAARQHEIQVEREVEVEVKEPQPVSIYIMLDHSGSMWIPDPLSIIVDPAGFMYAFKWIAAVDSITNFVNDPASANINVALQYFPMTGGTCAASPYDTPAVSMGRLPGHATAITDSLVLVLEGGEGTPIEPALRGGTEYCRQFQNDPAANPDGEDCVLVLITDGWPTECSQDPAQLAAIAGEAYDNDGIYTFAVGMAGADFIGLDQIAQRGQGGHDCNPNGPFVACDVSSGMTLLEALELIRSYVVRIETHIEYETVIETEALECEWTIPDPPQGENLDLQKVNAEFSPTGAQADKDTIPMADDESACGSAVAWYYGYDEGERDPTRIVACPEACNTIQSAERGTIDIVIGCEVVRLE